MKIANHEIKIKITIEKIKKPTTADQDFIRLNNLYLAIERGEEKLTIHNSNELRTLAGKLYNDFEEMQNHWLEEFQMLPNWNNI